MAHIAMFVGGFRDTDGSLLVSGEALLSDGGDVVNWEVIVAYSALQAAVSSAITNAAIAAAEEAGHTVNPTDNRMLIAGAVGL